MESAGESVEKKLSFKQNIYKCCSLCCMEIILMKITLHHVFVFL